MSKEPKKAVIRARCPESLKDALDEVARIQRIDSADVIRIACESYVSRIRGLAFDRSPLIP
jgi:hypothetical protein